jgi:hypothetical protein
MDLISKMASTPPGVAAVYVLEALSGQVPVDGPSRICLGKTSCSQRGCLMSEKVRAEAVAYCEELMKQGSVAEDEVNSVEIITAPRGYIAVIEGAVDRVLELARK